MDHHDLKGRHAAKPANRFSVTLAPSANSAARVIVPVTAATAPAAKRKAKRAHPLATVTRCVWLGRV